MALLHFIMLQNNINILHLTYSKIVNGEDAEWVLNKTKILQYYKRNYYGIFKPLYSMSKKLLNLKRDSVSKLVLHSAFNSIATFN